MVRIIFYIFLFGCVRFVLCCSEKRIRIAINSGLSVGLGVLGDSVHGTHEHVLVNRSEIFFIDFAANEHIIKISISVFILYSSGIEFLEQRIGFGGFGPGFIPPFSFPLKRLGKGNVIVRRFPVHREFSIFASRNFSEEILSALQFFNSEQARLRDTVRQGDLIIFLIEDLHCRKLLIQLVKGDGPVVELLNDPVDGFKHALLVFFHRLFRQVFGFQAGFLNDSFNNFLSGNHVLFHGFEVTSNDNGRGGVIRFLLSPVAHIRLIKTNVSHGVSDLRREV